MEAPEAVPPLSTHRPGAPACSPLQSLGQSRPIPARPAGGEAREEKPAGKRRPHRPLPAPGPPSPRPLGVRPELSGRHVSPALLSRRCQQPWAQPGLGLSPKLGMLLLALALALAAAGGEAPSAGGNCSFLQEMDVIQKEEENCYCYVQNRTMHLQYIWSTLQVRVNSTEVFSFEPMAEGGNCHHSETVLEFAACTLQIFWKPERATETSIRLKQYGEDICFKIQPFQPRPYTVSVRREMLDGKLLFLSAAGILLFHFANSLSRSTKVFYLSGIILGVVALLIFVLLALRRFIPRHSTFWILMGGCWMTSLYFIYCFKENVHWLWSEHRIYLLGYFLAVGMISFAVCYQHGPLTSDLSITLFTWVLQFTAFLLIYCGVTIPQVAYAVIAVSLCSKGLAYPLGAACYIGRKMKNHFKPSKLTFKFLTEEEYEEQGERETARALELLRSSCRNPAFPTWLAITRLQSPHRFASFVLGSPHISPAEAKAHEEEYGIGSFFLEEQFFEPRAESEQADPANSIHEGDEEEEEEEDELPRQTSFLSATEVL